MEPNLLSIIDIATILYDHIDNELGCEEHEQAKLCVSEPMHKTSRMLVLTSPAFDFKATELPDNVRYVGPMLEDPSWTNNLSENEMLEKSSTPLVAVSFSTTFQNQEGILQKVIDALGQLPVRGIVSVGPSLDTTQFKVPSNVSMQRFARHSQLFAQSSVVVTHCGHSILRVKGYNRLSRYSVLDV